MDAVYGRPAITHQTEIGSIAFHERRACHAKTAGVTNQHQPFSSNRRLTQRPSHNRASNTTHTPHCHMSTSRIAVCTCTSQQRTGHYVHFLQHSLSLTATRHKSPREESSPRIDGTAGLSEPRRCVDVGHCQPRAGLPPALRPTQPEPQQLQGGREGGREGGSGDERLYDDEEPGTAERSNESTATADMDHSQRATQPASSCPSTAIERGRERDVQPGERGC